MIASFLLYGIIIGTFTAATAWLLEIALGGRGRARRHLWIAAILATVVVPPAAMLLQEPLEVHRPSEAAAGPLEVVIPGRVAAFLQAAPAPRSVLLAGRSLDELATLLWITATAAVLLYHLLNAWRLTRRARAWRPSAVDSEAIAVAQDLGPALYGWWRPRIVFPEWLLGAPAVTQRLALAHEREHLAARDPQILAAATLLTALLPWNAALWWMLRRLRFTMEVDCDARVLRGGADVSDYGLALLFVSERQAHFPNGTIALIERPSQLERRINIMVTSHRRPALVAGLCVALAGSCVFAAAQVAAPARIEDAPRKPVPGGENAMRLGHAFEQHIEKRYNGLLDEEVEGTAIVIALVNEEMKVEKSAQVISREEIEDIRVDESMFESIGMTREEVPYTGAMGMQSPTDPAHKLLVVYTEKTKPGERFVSKLAPDTRALDRQIFQRYFPDAARRGVPAGARPWVLLDRQGQVLRSGVEPLNPKELNTHLEARFAGIKTRETTLTAIVDDKNAPVKDGGGQELHMFSVWLAPDSPLPKS